MKRILWLTLAACLLCTAAKASTDISTKLTPSTQMFIAERDGLITLDIPTGGPTMMTRAPLARQQESHRLIAAPEIVDGVEMISTFIYIDPQKSEQLKALGVIVEEDFDSFVTAAIPVDKIEKVAALDAVKEIEVAKIVYDHTNMAKYYTNTNDVLNFSTDAIAARLPYSFTGKGVIVGVIDGGIDFQHTMFSDTSGVSRIKRAYMATNSYTIRQYDNISDLTTDYSYKSHGTHTASIAAGTPITVDGVTYGGMAPEADIVLAGLGYYSTTTNIANSIKRIFNYADSVGKPCVINISLGSHDGPHDGTGSIQKVFSQYAGENPNHIICISAGNDAANYGAVHNQGMGSNDSPFSTIIYGYAQSNTSYLNKYYRGYIWVYPRVTDTKLAIQFHVVNTSTDSILWTSDVITSSADSVPGIKTYFTASPKLKLYYDRYSTKYYYQIDFNDVTVNKQSDYSSSDYALAMSVYPTDGSCMIDCWDYQYNTFANYSATIDGYHFVAANDSSCISDMPTSNDIISVGAYGSKSTITTYSGSSYNYAVSPGYIAYFSSYQAPGYGPTGEAKPDICAPGAMVVAGINHNDYNYMSYSSSSHPLVYKNGTSSLGAMSGTSMAAPCAAGIIALYLQAAKSVGLELNTYDIRNLLQTTAIKDSHTSIPKFGPNGKIDALAGIEYLLSLSTDSISLNDATVAAGDTVVIPVCLTNTHSITAFQTDIFLPDGFELLQQDGDYLIEGSSRLTSSHSMMSNRVSNGAIRVACYSSSAKALSGNDGDILYLTVKVGNVSDGQYNIMLKNTRLTTTDYQELSSPLGIATITVCTHLLGDVNHDGIVDVNDVTALIAMILGNGQGCDECANVNGDEIVDVNDVTTLIAMILGN